VTYIVAIRSIEIERFDKVDVGIRYDSGVVKMVLTLGVWQEAVSDEDISSFRFDSRKLLAPGNVCIQVVLERGVETFWVVVEVLTNI
jgi:hypothetical protein